MDGHGKILWFIYVSSDVWAFGVVVWQVSTKCAQLQCPYEEITDAESIQNARNAEKRKLL